MKNVKMVKLKKNIGKARIDPKCLLFVNDNWQINVNPYNSSLDFWTAYVRKELKSRKGGLGRLLGTFAMNQI